MRSSHQFGQIEFHDIQFVPGQLHGEYRFALGGVGQVDKEYLVKAALADQLRRKRIHVVAGGSHKNRRLAVLHPAEEGTQQPGTHPCIHRRRIGTASGKNFFQFVNPQHGRRQLFGDDEHLADVLFGFSHEFVIDRRGVKFHQGQLPFAGDGAGAHAFATSLHPEDNHPPRRL